MSLRALQPFVCSYGSYLTGDVLHGIPSNTATAWIAHGLVAADLIATEDLSTEVSASIGNGGASIPAGIIAMWGGLASAIPTGWHLCDGTAGTPDLRGLFIKGAVSDAGATGGAATHGHTVTQASDHAALTHTGATVGNHVFTQLNGHSAHAFTQPGAHSAHVFTQPGAHAFTQPGAHSAHSFTQSANHVFTQPAAHSNHVFTQPAAHSNHVFTQPTVSWPAGVPTNAAHTHDAHTMTASGSSGATRASAPTTHSSIAPVISWPAGVPTNASGAVDAHSAHASGAVDAHSAHASGAVDAHSGAGVDAHSAHAGGAVDAHAGGAVDAHSAHSGGAVDAHSAHAGGAVDAHTIGQASAHATMSHAGSSVNTVSNEPAFYSLAYIMKL